MTRILCRQFLRASLRHNYFFVSVVWGMVRDHSDCGELSASDACLFAAKKTHADGCALSTEAWDSIT
eukprot:5561397-Amphidinium_carterae.1